VSLSTRWTGSVVIVRLRVVAERLPVGGEAPDEPAAGAGQVEGEVVPYDRVGVGPHPVDLGQLQGV
jgi:hypothetical protein